MKMQNPKPTIKTPTLCINQNPKPRKLKSTELIKNRNAKTKSSEITKNKIQKSKN
jgi:hypothetical protein